MDSIVQFSVNDTSPTVSYSPNDWTPCFSDIGCQNQWNQSQPTPTGSSYHLTSTTGASFTLKWRGTGVLLKGTASCISYTVYLDDSLASPQSNPSQNTLASIQNITLQDHNVTLLVGNRDWDHDCNISYTGAVVYVDDTAAGSPVSLNETDIDYTGSWSDYGPFKHSSAAGDVASTSVQGLSFFLYGMSSPSSGLYSVSLVASNNNTINRRFTANSSSTTFPANTSYLNLNALLYYASDLDPTLSYNVTVTNQGGGDLFIKSTGFQVFRSNSTSATTSATSTVTSKGTIAAIVLGIVLFVLFAALLLFYIFVYRPRNRRWREDSDALKADKAETEEERNRNTVMQLEEARISQSSSYRRRLARIISMIAPVEVSKRPSWKNDSQHLQQLSPLSPASTHKSDYILDISRKPNKKRDDRRLAEPVRYTDIPSTEEDGPITTLESEPQRPRDEENGVILHHRIKSSPDATIPVSPSISSGGGTQSRSHNSSQPRSGRFSIPFSLSIPYVRTRSLTEDGNGRRSRMDNRCIESDRPGSDDTSLSTIVFAKVPKAPPPLDRGAENRWDIRKSVKSFMSGLGGVGKRWYNTRASARAGDVIYPFVGVPSTAPAQRRALSGGLLIIGRDSAGATDDVESPITDNGGEENGPERSLPTGTDITPLSYATQSDDAYPSGEVEPRPEEQGSAVDESSPALPQQEPFSPHPYAAAALLSDPEAQSHINVVGLQNASSEGPRQRPQTAPAPSKVAFRQLPVIPKPVRVVHSVPPRARPHTADGPVNAHFASHGTITTGGRAIRALPPLPVPSVPAPTVQIVPSSAEQAHAAQKSPLTPQSAVQDDTASLPPPYPQSGHSKSSQRTSGSIYSTHSSLRPPFLNVREISPFQVNFPYSDDEQSQYEGKTKPPGAPSMARTRPTLEIPSTDAVLHPTAAITPRTTRSIAQSSFLDFATNSSSSNKEGSTREKSEASPVSEVGPSRLSNIPPLPPLPVRSLDEPSRVEDKEDLDDHSRRTFGQKRRSSSGSFYYNPADNMSLASPATSSFTHLSHHTHQSYQTGPSQEQRLSQSSQRRQHVSWRATFGGRIEGEIPEEATPSDSSPPFSLPARGSPIDPQPATASVPQSPLSRSSPPGLLPEPSDQIPHDVSQDEVRRSYMSTSSSRHSAHIHPFSVRFNSLSSRSQYPPQVQTELISPESTDDVSVSSPIQFRAGGLRRTSSGDVQPVSSRHPPHTRDGGSSSGGSGDLRPRHPFSIP